MKFKNCFVVMLGVAALLSVTSCGNVCSENCLKSILYAFSVLASKHFCVLQYSK